MTEVMEKIHVSLHSPGSEDCPFCPGDEVEHKWKTIKGARNDRKLLRMAMNEPSRCSYAQQSGAKPKDGKGSNQNVDSTHKSPSPIYSNSAYGAYGNQAHHSISGKEIMDGHAIEKILANEDNEFKLKGQTGYTINNAANGVYLPSYPDNYSGNEENKYSIVKLAMEAGKGQTHIGSHTGHDHEAGQDYPSAIREELTALKRRVLLKSKECPFCVDNKGKPKKPFIPPYKLNQWLDNLSKDISADLKGPVESWPYFVSKYAKRYYKDSIVDVPSDEDLL